MIPVHTVAYLTICVQNADALPTYQQNGICQNKQLCICKILIIIYQ
nr:MAG TPA: hypothetical protein [Caudoviricetes sp.]